MSLEMGKAAIDYFCYLSEGAEVLDFTFTGGEPTIDFSLLSRLVEYAVLEANRRGMGASISIKTNGTLLSNDHHEFLRRYRCTIFISLDGMETDNNTFRTLHGGNPYRTGVATAVSLMQNNVDVIISMSVHPNNAKRVLRGVEALVALGLTRVNIAPVYGTAEWSDKCIDSFMVSLREVASWIRQNKTKYATLAIGPIYEDTEHHSSQLENVSGCGSGSSTIAFLPNGNICGCSSLAMISNNWPHLVVGNVITGINQISLDKFLAMTSLNKLNRSKCSRCKAVNNCSGGCPAINFATNEDALTPPDIYCRTISAIEDLWKIAWSS